MIGAVRAAMRPGVTTSALDDKAKAVYEAHGLAQYHVYGIGHGIGLRFEEPPAPTIIPPHRNMPLAEGMTVTIGHPVLAIPGFGGARFEDVYRVAAAGPELLYDYPIDPIVGASPRLRGAPMAKPSVVVWSANPITSKSANVVAPVAADWPMASPSEKLCRPRPTAVPRATWRGVRAIPESRAPILWVK